MDCGSDHAVLDSKRTVRVVLASDTTAKSQTTQLKAKVTSLGLTIAVAMVTQSVCRSNICTVFSRAPCDRMHKGIVGWRNTHTHKRAHTLPRAIANQESSTATEETTGVVFSVQASSRKQ